MPTGFVRLSLLLASALLLNAFSALSPDQTKQLKDAGGWDYLKMTDTGIQTQHDCFDGNLHPDTCSGRLILSSDDKFTQEVTIAGQKVARRGTYTLEDDQLTFFDEFATRDGPYTIEIDLQNKSLVMYTSAVRIELVLHKTLHDKKRKETK
jgi:hypothetical protein